ncbi:MAG: AraC family transcriptional regulator [Bacteroidota bacterium]|nr:AraC family transcriptional regulator [Bacteroidota bacterium]
MKAYLEQLLIPDEEIFLIKRNLMPKFTAMRHYHRELEFKYMVSGTGKAFIGENIYEYESGDLVLVGPNLPHHWESSNHYSENGTIADCVYVQFKEDFLGDTFYNKTDMLAISKLFQKSRQGIQFSGNTAVQAGNQLIELMSAVGFDRLLGFLNVLNFLSKSFEYKLLTNIEFAPTGNIIESDKLNKIYQYISHNYKGEIQLDKAASLVNMSKSAFCQYFKKRTLKNFSDFVNEMRVGNAIKLVLEKEKTISEACYESGFNNISYFNRKFKQLHKSNPTQYFNKRKSSLSNLL